MDKYVILAGAGVSSGWPSALPGWKPMNRAIAHALCESLERRMQRQGWLADVMQIVDARRDADRFPPEYQAQVIEEMCGERYFRALQALDIDVINAAHDAIAAMAAAGMLRAIVTTNFDRLIEHALERRGVADVPIIKIHGSVSDHLSMIDTLKQRRRGSSAELESRLAPLHSSPWIYAGFSAADLDGDANYLGLVRGATRSPGATYIAFPGNPKLGKGAETLMNAYGDRGKVVIADVADYLNALSGNTPPPIDASVALGPALVEAGLRQWADSLSISASGLCLAAILEAIGEGEAAVRILDRIARKEQGERGTDDFRAVQLHYGRLGAAWGRFINVPDLNGAQSNAAVESAQSLTRVGGYEAQGWLICACLWHDRVRDAMGLAVGLGDMPAPSDEAEADGWLAVAQLFLINAGEKTLEILIYTAPRALACAERSGDVVRHARVAALYLLALSQVTEDRSAFGDFDAAFEEAERVGDGFALGMRALALRDVEAALAAFERQGMDPWYLYALLQLVKKLADQRRIEDADQVLQTAGKMTDRFPVFGSHFNEVLGQVKTMIGDEDAPEVFRRAIDAAIASDLDQRVPVLEQYFR